MQFVVFQGGHRLYNQNLKAVPPAGVDLLRQLHAVAVSTAEPLPA
jgi:hypothetical protein